MKKIAFYIFVSAIIFIPAVVGAISISTNPVVLGDAFYFTCTERIYLYDLSNTSDFILKGWCYEEVHYDSNIYGSGSYIAVDTGTDFGSATLDYIRANGQYHGEIAFYISEPPEPPATHILIFGALSDLTDYITGFFTDLWAIIALAIGLPLAFYVIRKIIALTKR